MQTSPTRQPEAGFAMLLVFLLAACVAISLYMELPRVVFEAQRNREGLLIERGEQYKRAIQLYFRATRQYPTTLEALESTNNRRFLRKRYKDPMTGEDEWRVIHVAAGGIFTDSLVNKPPGQAKPAEVSTVASAEPPPPIWMQRRASDGGMPAGPMQGSMEQPLPEPQQEAAPAGEQQLTASPQPAEGQPSPALEPGLAQPVAGPGQQPGTTFQPGFPAGPPAPGQSSPYPPVPVPGLQQPYGQAPVVVAPGQSAIQQAGPSAAQPSSPTQPTGAPGSFNQPGAIGTPGAPGSNPIAPLLNAILRTPNPGGLAAIQSANSAGGQQIGGGIAGVASKLEAEGIKVYNDRTKYNEWEFVYDFRQDRTAAGSPQGPRNTTGR
jgi:type II secretory pathway pseudopilin PulG